MVEDSFDTFEREVELFGSEHNKERYLEEDLEPPSYKNKIPLGRNPDTGEVKWVDMNDDDRWAVIGRCLHPEEGIKTDNGYMSIKKLFDQYQGEKIREDEVGEWFELNENLKTASLQSDGSIDWTMVDELYRQRIDDELIMIELQNGTTLKVSKNHPLLTQNDYTKSENIIEGDYIAIPKQNPMVQKRNIDNDLAELVAFQIAEGGETGGSIIINVNDPKRLEWWREKYLEFIDAKEKPTIKKDDHSSGYILKINQKNGLNEYLELLESEIDYEFGNKSIDKQMPQGIIEADREAKRHFLQVYIDCDGSIEGETWEHEFSSGSRNIVESIREICKEFGISGQIYNKVIDGETYWRFCFNSEESKKYAERVGYRKKSADIERKMNSNTNGMPVCKIISELKEKNIPVGEVRSYDSGKKPSKEKVENLIRRLKDVKIYHKTGHTNVGWNAQPQIRKAVYEDLDLEYIDSVIERLRWYIEKDVWWVKVKNKEKIEYSGYIYDLTMSENRNFVCNDVISSNTGSGKSWTLKEIVSRVFDGGMGVIHLSDVKNDFSNLSHGDGIQKNKMNLLKNEQRKPIPVNMYVPKFLEGDYFDGVPTSDHFHTFSYSVSDLSESDFLQLLQADSTSARNIAIALYEQVEEGEADSITDLVNFLEEDESMEDVNTMSKRSMKSTLESIKKQGVVSNRGNKEPLDNINDSVCVIAFENYDKYKRKSLEKLELQISITIRKLLDKIRENKVEKDQVLIVVDEAHAFAGDKSELSTEDITDAVDLGRAYGLPMAFATQKYTDLDEGIRTQCNKFLLSQNVTVEERRTVLKETGHYKSGDAQRGKFQRIFSNMNKHEWMYVDDQEYYKVKPLSPLCKD